MDLRSNRISLRELKQKKPLFAKSKYRFAKKLFNDFLMEPNHLHKLMEHRDFSNIFWIELHSKKVYKNKQGNYEENENY